MIDWLIYVLIFALGGFVHMGLSAWLKWVEEERVRDLKAKRNRDHRLLRLEDRVSALEVVEE